MGDHWCHDRCQGTATLITPTLLVTTTVRFEDQFPHGIRMGLRTVSAEVVPTEVGMSSAVEIGFGLQPLDEPPLLHRYAVACFEQRLSGIAPCCSHLVTYDAEIASGGRLRYYWAAPDAWDLPLPARYLSGDRAFVGGVCGPRRTEEDCAAEPGCTWRPTRDGGALCIHPSQDAAGANGWETYREYVEACPAPLAPDDAVIGDYRIFLLSERVDEAVIAPIPIGTVYSDGSDDPAAIVAVAGDTVGFGDNVSRPAPVYFGGDGVRRVANDSTALSFWSGADEDWRNYVRPYDGTNVPARGAWMRGDGLDDALDSNDDRGPYHEDFGAPLILGDTPASRRVFGVHLSAASTYYYDRDYSVHLTALTSENLRNFLDPDGDGRQVGFVDAPSPNLIDADGDGLSEYRIVAGSPGPDCIEAVPPADGICWRPTGNDNCGPPPGSSSPATYANPDQRDRDGDRMGDVCDNCPVTWNPDQDYCVALHDVPGAMTNDGESIATGDAIGVACHIIHSPVNEDADLDDIPDACDPCPGRANGGAGVEDADGDGHPDGPDGIPWRTGAGRVAASEMRASDEGITLVIDRGVGAGGEVVSYRFLDFVDPPGASTVCP